MISYVYLKFILTPPLHITMRTYSLIRSDHPSNSKRGGVCLYYKESLDVKIINLSARKECIICEVVIENCKGFITVMYISPS